MECAAARSILKLLRIAAVLCAALLPLAEARDEVMPNYVGGSPTVPAAALGERAKFVDAAGALIAEPAPAAVIAWQLPPAGETLATDAAAVFGIGAEKLTPDLEGLPLRYANAILTALGAKVDVVEKCGGPVVPPSDVQPEAWVKEQCTKPGKPIPANNHVGVVVGGSPHVSTMWRTVAIVLGLLAALLGITALYYKWKYTAAKDELDIMKSPK